MKLFAVLSALVLLLTPGCTWVAPTEAGESVQVLEAVPDASCARVGRVTATTKATLAGMSRGEEKMGRELDALAQTQAASLGGNVVVAASEINAGRREYEAYRCPIN